MATITALLERAKIGDTEARGLLFSTAYAELRRLARAHLRDGGREVLEQAEPRLAKVVEMRYFGGYTELEIAEALEITERTVQRDWEKARLLLEAALR